MSDSCTTFSELVPGRVFADLRVTVARAMPHLTWRYNGLGVLQAYLMEGESDELRVHIWHPSLEKPGIKYSGKIHDHRFDLRSTVLLGSIGHVEYNLTPRADGTWGTHEVVNARKAMADNSVYKGGLFDGQVESTGEFFAAAQVPFTFRERDIYIFPKGRFHESFVSCLCVTLVRKLNQEERKAKILAPRGQAVTHAFAAPMPECEWRPVIDLAVDELLRLNVASDSAGRKALGSAIVAVRPTSRVG